MNNSSHPPGAPKLKFKVNDIIKYGDTYLKILAADVRIRDTLSGTRDVARYEVIDLTTDQKAFFIGEYAQRLQTSGAVVTAIEILVKLGIDVREDL